MSPATHDEQKLHQRLLDGDDTASSEVCCFFLEKLVVQLERKFRTIVDYDEQIIWEVVTDMLLGYCDGPEQYNPELKSLWGYLYMAASGDIQNRWAVICRENARRDRRVEQCLEQECENGNGGSAKHRLEEPESSLAHFVAHGWTILMHLVPEDKNPRGEKELVRYLDQIVELEHRRGNKVVKGKDSSTTQAVAFWHVVQGLADDERELQVYVLMFSGVRETSAYAKVLGIANASIEEQRAKVKRTKDKLKKRLKRADWSALTGGEGNREP